MLLTPLFKGSYVPTVVGLYRHMGAILARCPSHQWLTWVPAGVEPMLAGCKSVVSTTRPWENKLVVVNNLTFFRQFQMDRLLRSRLNIPSSTSRQCNVVGRLFRSVGWRQQNFDLRAASGCCPHWRWWNMSDDTGWRSSDFSNMMPIPHYPVSQKKQDTLLLPITLSNVDHFQNSFTITLSSKRTMKQSLKIPPHLKCVATLPCKR